MEKERPVAQQQTEKIQISQIVQKFQKWKK